MPFARAALDDKGIDVLLIPTWDVLSPIVATRVFEVGDQRRATLPSSRLLRAQ